ncbi:MAG: AAA family ATPase, partial [Desulfurococcaceae archaeon]
LPVLKGEKGPPLYEDWSNLSKEVVDQKNVSVDWQKYNIAIRLDNLVCLDVEDTRIYNAIFKKPVEEFSKITWVQKTGKGLHIIFKGKAKPFKVEGFIEIRSGPQQYIVVAPSLHPSGTRYEWLSNIANTPIAEISAADLERLRHKLEVLKRFRNFIEAMADCWKRYHRHHLSLWLSGCLRKMNLGLEDSELVLKTICLLAGDEELADRVRALHDTFEKDIKEVKAWSGLREELVEICGLEEAKKIIKLLPIQKGLLFEVKNLRELIDSAAEISYISYPLIPNRCLIVLAGRGGVGKSMLSLYLAHCVSSGRRIFDYYDVKQSKVLIIDNENSPMIYKQRAELLDLNPLDAIEVVNFTNWRMDKKGALAKLQNLIKTNGYNLIIMDNWTTLKSNIEENKSTEVSNVLTKLRKIAYETNSTILLIHHLRKGMAYATHEIDELRGSSVIVNEADIVYLLEKDNVTGVRLLKSVKNRMNNDDLNIRLSFSIDEDGTLRIVYCGELEKAEFDTRTIEAAKAIKEFLTLKKTATRKDIFQALKGYPETTIKRGIDYLIVMGVIERVSRGVYKLVNTLDQVIEG